MIETTLSRLQWVSRFVLASLVGTLLLSNKVWVTDRNFPLVPIFNFFPTLPSPVDLVVYYVFIVLAIYQAVNLTSRNTLYALLGIFVFLMLGDQMRWQPYNIQYLIMIIGMLFIPKRNEQVINVFRLMLVTYFVWTGFQEFSKTFSDVYFPWLSSPFAKVFPASIEPYIQGSGYLFAVLNIFTGIGLLFDKTRNGSVIVGSVIQLLFYSLISVTNSWNYAILPFNLCLVALLFLLFYTTQFRIKDIFWSKSFVFHQVTLVFFSLLPILSIFGYYDRMQSFNVYSGKNYYARIYVTEDLVNKLPDGLKKHVIRPLRDDPYIEVSEWFEEIKVDPYSEKRVFEYLKKYVCSFSEGECEARLKVRGYTGSKNIEFVN